MVRALLSRTKTQTRRALTVQPSTDDLPNESIGAQRFGLPGDRLWVKEAWRTDAAHDALAPRELSRNAAIYYAAGDARVQSPDGLAAFLDMPMEPPTAAGRYRNSMFMPRWASRIALEVVAVRIERLQECSSADARAEGVVELPRQHGDSSTLWTADVQAGPALHGITPRHAYQRLWERINGTGTWATNPWVLVVEFEPVLPHL